MKTSCIIVSLLILFAIMAVCVMVKFATDISLNEKMREEASEQQFFRFGSLGMIPLSDEPANLGVAQRFPFVAAIITNSSKSYSFSCFASVILIKWVITAAHCRRADATHRVILYYNVVRNFSKTYPITLWRRHENFNPSNPFPMYDIAVAKMNVDQYPFSMKSSGFDVVPALTVEITIWKTMSTMTKHLFLTNEFQKYDVRINSGDKCTDAYGITPDESIICVDLSDYDDCFVHEFGPLYHIDRVVGVLAVKPKECDLKVALFTNVSFYTNWILTATGTIKYT